MGKSLRTSLVSYTSLYLRRSRTGRGFEFPTDRASESSRTPAPHPIASNSSSHPGQGDIGEPSRSLRDPLRHYQTSPHFDAPKRPPLRGQARATPLPERRRAASLTDDLPQNIPSSHPWWPAEVANASWNPPPKAATNTVGPDRSLIRPFFMPLCTEVRRRPPRSPVGPQLHFAIYGPGHPSGFPGPIS